MDQQYIPCFKSWRLNERYYGGLTGLNKEETKKQYGADQVHIWRRSYDIPPPEIDIDNKYHPIHDNKYKLIPKKLLPNTESLKMT